MKTWFFQTNIRHFFLKHKKSVFQESIKNFSWCRKLFFSREHQKRFYLCLKSSLYRLNQHSSQSIRRFSFMAWKYQLKVSKNIKKFILRLVNARLLHFPLLYLWKTFLSPAFLKRSVSKSFCHNFRFSSFN